MQRIIFYRSHTQSINNNNCLIWSVHGQGVWLPATEIHRNIGNYGIHVQYIILCGLRAYCPMPSWCISMVVIYRAYHTAQLPQQSQVPQQVAQQSVWGWSRTLSREKSRFAIAGEPEWKCSLSLHSGLLVCLMPACWLVLQSWGEDWGGEDVGSNHNQIGWTN